MLIGLLAAVGPWCATRRGSSAINCWTPPV